MIKICDSAPDKSLLLFFQNCLNRSTFPDIWKKSNVCPVHKKKIKNKKLLAITHLFHCSLFLQKIFEKPDFKSLFEYLDE